MVVKSVTGILYLPVYFNVFKISFYDDATKIINYVCRFAKKSEYCMYLFTYNGT